MLSKGKTEMENRGKMKTTDMNGTSETGRL
jgi:hypothetical protein